jgi:methylated-DNA-protein-cysteine methyltransferase-like protein
MGEFFVDFAVFGWFPEMLPSEEAEMEGERSSEEESDEEGIAAGG